MLWTPKFKVETDSVAVLPLSETVLSVAAPSLNVTVPVGDAPLTVAVNVVELPCCVGLTLDVKAVVVAPAMNTVAVRVDVADVELPLA